VNSAKHWKTTESAKCKELNRTAKNTTKSSKIVFYEILGMIVK